MTEPVPDISQPAALRGMFDALAPRGTDNGTLMDALKASLRAPVAWCRDCDRPHPENVVCPERADRLAARKAAKTDPPSLADTMDPAKHACKPGCLGGPVGTTCHSCGGPDSVSPEGHREGCEYARLEKERRALRATFPSLPADPFTPGSMADAATAEWFHGLVEAGIPAESVERIIGAMFANLVLARETAQDGE